MIVVDTEESGYAEGMRVWEASQNMHTIIKCALYDMHDEGGSGRGRKRKKRRDDSFRG